MPTPYDTNTTGQELLADYASLIKDKNILITGASQGSLGNYYVKLIAKAKPACLILGGRSVTTMEQCAEEIQDENPGIQIRPLQMDLGSFKSVRDAANKLNNWDDIDSIDVLVNNAGVMAVEYQLSADGFETHLATNHLGHFLFTNLIMKKLLKSNSPRVIMVASDGHRLSPLRFDDYNFDVSCRGIFLHTF